MRVDWSLWRWYSVGSILLLELVGVGNSWSLDDDQHHPCNIQRFHNDAALYQRFGSRGVPSMHTQPLIIRNSDRNQEFRQRTEREELLRFFSPTFSVTLSSSNAVSEHRRTVPLMTYLDEIAAAGTTPLDQPANESWYLFGETHSPAWQELLQHYRLPPCQTCSDRSSVALSFGIGNRGSGVQWHVHGPGFSEALHGRKHWVLLPPSIPPLDHHKDQSSRQWMEYVYPILRASNSTTKIWECTLDPGDAIYFPDHWWHATINLDPYTAFISAFTTEHHSFDEL